MPIPPLRPLVFRPFTKRVAIASSAATTRVLPTMAARPFAVTKDTPPTFFYENQLPRLPVPDLEKSLEGYVKSLAPVIEQKYGAGQLAKEMEKRKLYAKDFMAPDGIGRVLQERLRDLDEISPNNWLDDTLWLALAYHSWRAPLLVNSNWWLLFKNDAKNPDPPVLDGATNKTVVSTETNPRQAMNPGSEGGGKKWLEEHQDKKALYQPFNYDEVVKMEWVTDWQIRRAAWLTHRFAEIRERVQKGTVPPEVSRAGPLCMDQYKKLFNISRIPLPNCDAFSAIDNDALHATVMINDFVYSVDVFAKPAKVGDIPSPLPVGEIERLFQAVAADAKKRTDAGEEAARVGILTADHRDTWTKNREKILLISPQNRASFDSINRSLIAINLDRYTLPTQPTEDPLRMAPVDAQLRNASTGIQGGRNRWYDKCLSIPVENNGRAAVMGEHSPIDALIPSFVVDYALDVPVDESQFQAPAGAVPTQGEGWKREDFVINQEIQDEIAECTERNKAIIADSDVSTLWWAEYGTDWIKKVAKISPDAYVQQVLQLAWFRDQGYASATYETASTRTFKHGRTDVIRSLTPDSREFVKAMQNPDLDDAKRYELLQKATVTHNDMTKTSSAGAGYDRHLMGLKVQLRPGETHPLFEDEMYAKSQEWKLSTSGLSSGIRFYATGFGSAWPDGYGINYMAGPNVIKFGLESKVSCNITSTTAIKHQLAQAFRDIRAVCESQAGKTESAKL